MAKIMDVSRPLLPEILGLHGKWRSSKAAIIHPGGISTWSDFVSATNRIANGLRERGLCAGDRVGLIMSNDLATIEVIFGLIRAGMVAVPINLSAPDAAIARMLNDAGVVALFVTGDQVARAESIRRGLPDLRSDGLFVAGLPSVPPEWTSYSAWLVEQSPTDLGVAVEGSTIANIIYSSGTTGTPKGIAHTQQSRLDWAYDLALALRYHSGARTLLTLGLYSNISWVMMLCTLLTGGTLILQQRFDAEAALRAIAQHAVTHTAMVPVQYRRLLSCPDIGAFDLSSVQSVMSCGSALPPDLKATLLETFRCGVIELYGVTEGVITTLDPEDAPGRLASVGKPIQGTDIRVIDDSGRDVAPGESGEIVGLCRFTMEGYWNRPAATAEATWIDEQGRGWLRTGDIGRLDADGFLYIVDRKKDMILSGGQNIFPADIESVLLAHPAVIECAVIGVPHPEWGETPLAVVVLGANKFTADDLRAWLNERVGRQQRISAVMFSEQLPRNPNGKVLKRELRALFEA